MSKVIKFNKNTGCSGMDIDLNITHLTSPTNYATLCGIGEEEFGKEKIVNEILTCPQCLAIVKIVKKYLKS